MLALLETLRQGTRDLAGVSRSHGLWMSWNTFLALIPLALAFSLFRPRRNLNAKWWIGVMIFVLFLPNAPYVITDVVHLFDDIRGSRSDLQVLGVYLPVYLVFFTVGLVSYTASLQRLWRFVKGRTSAGWALLVEAALHLLCAVGLYLGRVVRLNSWQVFTRPQRVAGSLDWLLGPFPVFVILVTAVVLGVCSLMWRVAHAGAWIVLRPGIDHLRTGRWASRFTLPWTTAPAVPLK